MENMTQKDATTHVPKTPVGIARSRDAFLRDLPELLANPKYDRWSVLYQREKQIAIAETEIELIRECNRRGIREEDCYIGCICPHSDDEVEEIEIGFYEHEEVNDLDGDGSAKIQ